MTANAQSPIEFDMQMALAHAVREGSGRKIETEVPVASPWGHFRFDFVLTSPSGTKLAIECDGAQFHDSWRDEYRDAVTLGSGCADEVWRFTGATIHKWPWVCVYLLTLEHPEAFRRRLRPDEGTQQGDSIIRTPSGYEIRYCDHAPMLVSRRTRAQLTANSAPWCELWEFAKLAGPMSLDALVALAKTEEGMSLYAQTRIKRCTFKRQESVVIARDGRDLTKEPDAERPGGDEIP